MSLPAYHQGDLARLGNWSGASGSAAFSDPAGTPTDPTAVTLTVKRPDGTTLVYGYPSAGADGTLTRESAGRFYADVELDQAGLWAWELAGTGAVTTAEQAMFRVLRRWVA